jgi:AbrB family looped-hinge helix DNA binding protein
MNTAILTQEGKTTIPKDIRDQLALKAGDKLYFCVLPDGSISIRIKKGTIFDIAGILKSHRATPVSIEEMDNAIQQSAAQRYLNTKE